MAPSQALEAVLFDFGNVLCTVDVRRTAEALATVCGRTPQALTAAFEASDLPGAYERGEVDSAGFLRGIRRICGREVPEAVFLRAFTDIFTPIEDTWRLVQELSGRIRLGLVSNTNPWHFEHGIRPTAVFPRFETVTLSYQVGAMKPDPRIYRDALEKLGLPPGACLLVDDLPENIEGARRLGMRGIVYTDPGSLRASLRGWGLEV